jgi:hypothetical protein
MQVRKVTEADIEKIPRTISRAGHKHQANRVVAIMSKMFGLALRWKMGTDGANPCKGIERHFEGHRERYLTTDEANAARRAGQTPRRAIGRCDQVVDAHGRT